MANLRAQAYEAEQNLEWNKAAELLAQVIANFTDRELSISELARRDISRLREREQACRVMARQEAT